MYNLIEPKNQRSLAMEKKILSVFLLVAVALQIQCSKSPTASTPTPPSGNNGLTVGGKVQNASFANGVLTFSPSDEFYSARFYDGEIAFSALNGTQWSSQTSFARIADNSVFGDGTNDWKSPFDLSSVSGLVPGHVYTMFIFYTSNISSENDQGTIVFTR
jgi:hypothetical protein